MSLILSRKVNESITIECQETMIEVVVIRNLQGKIRLAFNAPPEVKIYRTEILQRKETTMSESA